MWLGKISQTKGFTLIEIVITLGIMAIILTIGSFGFNVFNSKVNLNSTAELMISDLRSTALSAINAQQFQGETPIGWGVYLDKINNRYIIFAGFSQNGLYLYDKNKFKIVNLPKNIIINNLQFEGRSVASGSLFFYLNSGVPIFENNFLPSDPDGLNIQLSNSLTNDSINIYINSLGIISQQ